MTEYMKPTISSLFTANSCIQDITSKKFTFIDLFSIIYIPKDQLFTLQNFVVGGRVFGLNPGKFIGEVKVVDPEGVVLQTSLLEGNLGPGDLLFNAAFSLVKIEKPGRHFLRFSTGGQDLLDGDRYFFDVARQI